MVFCSLDGKPVQAMEGFSVNADMALEELDKEKIRSFIVPGGNISMINNANVKILLQELKSISVSSFSRFPRKDFYVNRGSQFL